MNKLIQITKIALLTIILADELRKAIKKNSLKTNVYIDTIKLTEDLENKIKELQLDSFK